MKSGEQKLLQARCQYCRGLFDFKALDEGFTVPCPFCKKLTQLRKDIARPAPTQRVKLPQWVVPATSLLSITIIVTALLYGYCNYYVPLDMVQGSVTDSLHRVSVSG